MTAYEIRELYPSNKTLYQLQGSRVHPAIYRIIGSNRHIALVDERGNALEGINQLMIDDRVKVPMYKQAMDLQMGKIPKPYQRSTRIIQLRQMDISEDRSYSYKVIVARR